MLGSEEEWEDRSYTGILEIISKARGYVPEEVVCAVSFCSVERDGGEESEKSRGWTVGMDLWPFVVDVVPLVVAEGAMLKHLDTAILVIQNLLKPWWERLDIPFACYCKSRTSRCLSALQTAGSPTPYLMYLPKGPADNVLGSRGGRRIP